MCVLVFIMMDDLLEKVSELIRLSKGDLGRLEHIKNTLENRRTLYLSDKRYVEDLISKYIIKNTVEAISSRVNDENQSKPNMPSQKNNDELSISNSYISRKSSKSALQIGLIVGIGISIIIVFFGLHVYAISNLQFRNYQTDEPDFADMSANIQFEACNPTFFPVMLEQFNVDVIYKTTNFATVTVNDNNIAPYSSSVVSGRLKVNSEALVGLFLTALKSAFSDEKMPLQNPEELRFVAKFNVPVLGVIPFPIVKEYSNNEFADLMSGHAANFDC